MKRILIVDDDAMVRRALAQALTAAGFDAATAEEREEAEALLATQSYDLVITDLRLGDLTGFSGLLVLSEAAHRMGASRVLAMTGHANPLVESAVQELGADLLKKPFSLSTCVSLCHERIQ
jgi:DNA-binding response OmpR family regulator